MIRALLISFFVIHWLSVFGQFWCDPSIDNDLKYWLAENDVAELVKYSEDSSSWEVLSFDEAGKFRDRRSYYRWIDSSEMIVLNKYTSLEVSPDSHFVDIKSGVSSDFYEKNGRVFLEHQYASDNNGGLIYDAWILAKSRSKVISLFAIKMSEKYDQNETLVELLDFGVWYFNEFTPFFDTVECLKNNIDYNGNSIQTLHWNREYEPIIGAPPSEQKVRANEFFREYPIHDTMPLHVFINSDYLSGVEDDLNTIYSREELENNFNQGVVHSEIITARIHVPLLNFDQLKSQSYELIQTIDRNQSIYIDYSESFCTIYNPYNFIALRKRTDVLEGYKISNYSFKNVNNEDSMQLVEIVQYNHSHNVIARYNLRRDCYYAINTNTLDPNKEMERETICNWGDIWFREDYEYEDDKMASRMKLVQKKVRKNEPKTDPQSLKYTLMGEENYSATQKVTQISNNLIEVKFGNNENAHDVVFYEVVFH